MRVVIDGRPVAAGCVGASRATESFASFKCRCKAWEVIFGVGRAPPKPRELHGAHRHNEHPNDALPPGHSPCRSHAKTLFGSIVPVPSPSSRKNMSFFWAASRFRRAAVSCLGIPDPVGIKVNYPSGGLSMTPSRRKRHKPEQIVAKQCDAEAILNAGKELTAVLHGLSLATRPGHGRRRCALSMRLSLGRRMSSGLPTRRCRRWPTPSRTAAAASGRRTMGSSAPRGGDPEGAQRPPARCL